MPTRSRGRPFCLLAIVAVVVVIAALGIGLGVGLTNHKKATATSDQDSSAPNAVQSSTTNAADGSSTTNSTASTTTPVTVTPLEKWNWISAERKMFGLSLGNWLSIERWMDEDWFTGLVGANVWDEWGLSETLGATAATTALEAHYNTITADNISTIASYGFNHIRVPISFWAFIPLVSEPYVGGIQLAHLDRIAQACYANNMYILLDLHGLPGSQNGLQQSGHNTSDIEFWNANQQTRADATVQAAIDHITNSTYSSVYSAIAICNEPVTYTNDQLNTLTKFYERSYTKFAAMTNPIAMIFHDAYQGGDYWKPFINGKNASLLMIEDHPYPGNFPLQYNADDILTQVCQKAAAYTTYPIPTAVTEWSLTTGIIDDSFFKQFYAAQASAFSVSAGSIFWSWHTLKATHPVLANNTIAPTYSFVDLVALGDVVPMPAAGQNTSDFLASLTSGCTLSSPTYSAGTIQATATGASVAQLRRRHTAIH